MEAFRAHVRDFLGGPDPVLFIGHTPGRRGRELPAFLTRPQEAGRLSAGPAAAAGLAKYVLEECLAGEGRIGVMTRGCEAAALQRLVQDQRVPRARLHLVGVPCAGVADLGRIEAQLGPLESIEAGNGEWTVVAGGRTHRLDPSEYLEARCSTCTQPWPTGCDITFGQPALEPQPPAFGAVAELERLTPDQRYRFWTAQFELCLRCFACRQVCPACSCVECSLDTVEPPWLGREITVPSQAMFHYLRALHVAGRCVDCGQCERVCPVGVPVSLLNRKLARDIQELFGVENPFLPAEVEPLGKFRAEDREEFM